MNKKIYLSALVLPAVFSACTQEDLAGLNDNVQQSRVVLEEITFEDNQESRLAFEGEGSFNSFSLKGGDAIGAYLIDVPNSIVTDEGLADLEITAETDLEIEKALKAGYTIPSNAVINGSHKFVYDENTEKWKTLDQMVEGSYIYVLPYQDKKTREPITTSLPQIQYLKYKEGTTEIDELSLMNQVIESGKPLAVGYEFLSRYNSEVSGALKQIYAYPRITFTNQYDENVTIQKVVINHKDGFALEGTIDLNKAAAELMRLDSDPKANDLKNSTVAGDWTKAVSGNWYATDNYTSDIVTAGSETVDYIVVVAPENLTVADEASISFQAVIPADNYDAEDITIHVYTNKGIFTQNLGAVSLNNGLRYSKNNYDLTTHTLKPNVEADSKLNVVGFTQGSDMTVLQTKIDDTVSPVVVVDTKDLLAVINGAAEGTEATPAKITISPMSEVVINANVVSALGTKKGLVITEDIEIEGVTNGLLVKNIEFSGAVTVTEGQVSFYKSTLSELAIEAGASVIVDYNFPSQTDIVNEGTLSINATHPTTTAAVSKTLGTVTNLGTLNISTPLVATTVYNGCEDEEPVYADVVTTATINANAGITAAVVNYGALNVKNSITVSSIENAKVLNAAETASKSGVVTVDAGKMLMTGGSNAGTITINGEFRAITAFENSGTINNNYGMENDASVQLDNTGYIKVAKAAKYTSVNNNEGIIEIENRQSEIHADVNLGTILYTAEAGSTFEVLGTDKFNTVKFNEGTTLNVKMDATTANAAAVAKAAELTVLANAEGNYSFSQYVTSIAGISVSNNIYATIVSNVNITKAVNIGTGATLHLGTNVAMNYNRSEGFVNNGTFRNMGSLTALCNQPTVGTWTGSGTYSWGNVNTAATTALQTLISGATAGETIKLTESVIVSAYLNVANNLTIDLNGKTLERKTTTADEPIIYTSNSTQLVLKGNGIIKTNNSNAIWAAGSSQITIEGGDYINSTIFADASSIITVKGGYFEAAYDAETFGGQYTALNKRDNSSAQIKVEGGVFKNFNPAKCKSDSPYGEYINATTHRVDSYTDKNCTSRFKKGATSVWATGADYWYKVVAINAE